MNPQKHNLVVKSNRLIEASYRLSLVEMRLVMKAAQQARENALGLFPHEAVTVRALEFAEFFDQDRDHVYTQLKEALLTLFNRMVVTRDIDPETGFLRVNHIRWISKASYVDGSGNVQVIFAPDLIPHITSWFEGNFTKLRLEQIGKFTSVYAVRMYELMVSYKGLGARRLGIDELREMFGLIDEYPQFANLKKWVVDVAVQQINDLSDIKISCKPSKTGRKFTHLDFTIKDKAPARPKITKAMADKASLPGEADNSKGYERLRKARDAK
jgi:plasmid replication initiation protein